MLGIGSAGVFVTTTVLITDYFADEQQRRVVLGWQGSFLTFGGVVFVLVGGLLANLSWRLPFLIYAAGLLLLPLIAIRLYEPERAAIGSKYESVTKTELSMASIRRLFAQLPVKTLVLAYTIILVGQVVSFMVPVELPFYLRTTFQASHTIIGIAIATMTLSAAVVSTQYARIRRRFGVNNVVALTFAALGSGLLIQLQRDLSGRVHRISYQRHRSRGDDLEHERVDRCGGAGHCSGASVRWIDELFVFGQFLSPFVSEPISDVIGFESTFSVGDFVLLGLAGVFSGLQFRRSTRSSRPLTEGEETEVD